MRKVTRNYTIATIAVLVGFLIFLIWQNIHIRDAFDLAANFLAAPTNKIQSIDGRTNVLIMGKAGKEYAGGDLTDTMILASLSLKNPALTLVSIPRDLWIPEIRAKVNSAYHYGGIPLAQESVARVAGLPVQYGVVIDFSGFKDVVDVLGGIKVNVENGFTDNLYPIAGRENDTCGGDRQFRCRYETVSFSPGEQIMDGVTALKFVRSRHAEGVEGTDTAREARQQKVIEAIKNKLLSPQIFLNPRKDVEIFNLVKGLIQTDIDGQAGAIIGRKILDARGSIKQFLIPQELLYSPPITKTYDNQYVFIPGAGNGKWGEINFWVRSILP
jgi:anionic cell wall polymer biosynthesis LytR-Cps2A-Psr (LCP) family protein